MTSRSNRIRAKRLPRKDTRKCPSCGRGMALVLNPLWGIRYCRWAEQGRCELTEHRALKEMNDYLSRLEPSTFRPQ